MIIISYLKKNYLLLSFILVYTIFAIIVSLNRHWQYSTFYLDLGIFDQAIWRVSRFHLPIVDHTIISGKLIFADHFNPSIFLLSPLYWFTDKTEILLIFQAVCAGISAIVLYNLGFFLLPAKKFLVSSLIVAYLGYIGLQNALITDFHEATIAILPISLIFWAIFKKKLILFWLMLIIILGLKESMAGLGIGIGFFLIFKEKPERLKGILTIAISFIWGILAIKVIIPYFSGGRYYYDAHYPGSLKELITLMISPPIKVKTMLVSFVTFIFLPLSYFPLLPAIFENFFERFVLIASPTRWDLGLHYNAPLSPLLFIASLLSVIKYKIFQKIPHHTIILPLIIIFTVLILHRFILHGPLGLAYNPVFYRITKDNAFINDFIDKIPRDGLLMTQQNFATRFTHNCVLMLKTDYQKYDPDYVALDLREGQNPTNFYPISENDARNLFVQLKNDNRYTLKTYSLKLNLFTKIERNKNPHFYCDDGKS